MSPTTEGLKMAQMASLALKFKNIFPKEKISLGLDIGSSAIKFVKLKFPGATPVLCDFKLELIHSQEDLAAALKGIAQSQDKKDINISVSGPAAIIRYVNFPKMNNQELRQALRFEAQKHIPFSIDDLNLDSYILNEELGDNKMLVLLAAVKKDFFNQRIKLVETAGLKASIVDVDSIALINAFNFNYSIDEELKTKTIALLNIGASVSNLSILEGFIPRLSRDISIAGNNFTQKLMDIFRLDFRAAEELKLNPDKDKEKVDEIALAVEPLLTKLGNEMRTSFDYYESQNASTVAKIFLSGAGSKLSGLKDMLAKLMGIEVEYWEPLKRIDILDSIDSEKIKELSIQLAVAVGLALR